MRRASDKRCVYTASSRRIDFQFSFGARHPARDRERPVEAAPRGVTTGVTLRERAPASTLSASTMVARRLRSRPDADVDCVPASNFGRRRLCPGLDPLHRARADAELCGDLQDTLVALRQGPPDACL